MSWSLNIKFVIFTTLGVLTGFCGKISAEIKDGSNQPLFEQNKGSFEQLEAHLSFVLERLSSGLGINFTKDDATGLAIWELLRINSYYSVLSINYELGIDNKSGNALDWEYSYREIIQSDAGVAPENVTHSGVGYIEFVKRCSVREKEYSVYGVRVLYDGDLDTEKAGQMLISIKQHPLLFEVNILNENPCENRLAEPGTLSSLEK